MKGTRVLAVSLGHSTHSQVSISNVVGQYRPGLGLQDKYIYIYVYI